MKKFLLYGAVSVIGFLLVVFVVIQFIPYGRDHTNPPVVSEPAWDTPQTRELVQSHCFQCHSNETQWPWYTNIAPASWLIQFDVEQGRGKFNFSDWKNSPVEIDELVENIEGNEMPPAQYTIFHPDAILTAQQKEEMIAGFRATVK